MSPQSRQPARTLETNKGPLNQNLCYSTGVDAQFYSAHIIFWVSFQRDSRFDRQHLSPVQTSKSKVWQNEHMLASHSQDLLVLRPTQVDPRTGLAMAGTPALKRVMPASSYSSGQAVCPIRKTHVRQWTLSLTY